MLAEILRTCMSSLASSCGGFVAGEKRLLYIHGGILAFQAELQPPPKR